MPEPEIRGGADEFEAAVIAVVLDQISRDEKARSTRRPDRSSSLPAWVRITRPDESQHPFDTPRPGD